MIIHSISQLVTIPGGPQRGDRLGNLGIIENAAVLIKGEQIQTTGKSQDLLSAYPGEERLDARGCAVIPGLVDPHTHLVWAGDRVDEFEMRLQGKTYMEILEAGGGINNTVRKTRSADTQTLIAEMDKRAKTLLRHGTTSIEVKSGYGLDTHYEIRQLKAIIELNATSPMDLFPTFLGAHAIPDEFRHGSQVDVDGYTRLVYSEMLPAVLEWWKIDAPKIPLPFVDVFCEEGVFTLEQTRIILQTAKDLGFPLKLHADEFKNLGGVRLAVELGATSVDHLVKTSKEEIELLSQSQTAAVLLPATPFSLGEAHHAPARDMIEAGCLVALASDINPGTAWCESMQFILALACRTLKLTPAEALAASTINAAAAINQQDRIGSIEPGKQADLLILTVPDYRHLTYRFGGNLVKTVVKKGKVLAFQE